MTSSVSFVERARTLLQLIRFSHTLFALPYAVTGFVLGVREAEPDAARLWRLSGCALVAVVAARTAAMAFNRLADRRYDATNPRTRARPSVTGAVTPRQMAVVTGVSASCFVAASYLLNPLCGALSFVALTVILGYSYTKRVTMACHFVLGAALGLAPLGAYLAVTGAFLASAPGMIVLAVAVAFWTAGFDILYATADVEHDRREGLHSIPSALGVPRALAVARGSHALVPLLLAAAAWLLDLRIVTYVGIAIVAALLVVEHRLVRADDLSRVGTAFFQLNVAISAVVMTSVVVDVLAR